MKEYLASKGISFQYTAPYTPEQNGVSERKNRTLIEMSRCLLTEADLRNTFWGEVVLTANYIQNSVLTRAKEATPYELWNGSKPGINHFQMFGSKFYVHVPKEKRHKLENTGTEMVFVGYDEDSKAYRCYDADTNKLVISRDVCFVKTKLHENDVMINLSAQDEPKANDTSHSAKIDVDETTSENGNEPDSTLL